MRTLRVPTVLLPNKNIDPSLWAVVACDQFTSEREYWDELSSKVGDSPSTLRLIYPEAYMESGDLEKELDKVSQTMKDYYRSGVFEEKRSFILCERSLSNGKKRIGLVAELDLEDYDPFGFLSVRATEKTVRERLPLRMRIRKDAIMELPHILVLLDDPQKSVIDALYASKGEELYSFTLNMGGGELKGYALDEELTEKVFEKFEQSRGKNDASFYLAVGDGNHSLAAARECWLAIKKGLTEEEAKTHPARYALVEVVNLFEDSLEFEPIHRVVFNARADFIEGFPRDEKGRRVDVYVKGEKISFTIDGTAPEIIAKIQNYVDEYILSHPETKQDYVHGFDDLLKVAENAIGIVMPALDKESMFTYIDNNGVLTRKSFSMGEAVDKRYYYESRLIVPKVEAE